MLRNEVLLDSPVSPRKSLECRSIGVGCRGIDRQAGHIPFLSGDYVARLTCQGRQGLGPNVAGNVGTINTRTKDQKAFPSAQFLLLSLSLSAV